MKNNYYSRKQLSISNNKLIASIDAHKYHIVVSYLYLPQNKILFLLFELYRLKSILYTSTDNQHSYHGAYRQINYTSCNLIVLSI
jgi:hypothetical protein